jgi:hypothetical protein
VHILKDVDFDLLIRIAGSLQSLRCSYFNWLAPTVSELSAEARPSRGFHHLRFGRMIVESGERTYQPRLFDSDTGKRRPGDRTLQPASARLTIRYRSSTVTSALSRSHAKLACQSALRSESLPGDTIIDSAPAESSLFTFRPDSTSLGSEKPGWEGPTRPLAAGPQSCVDRRRPRGYGIGGYSEACPARIAEPRFARRMARSSAALGRLRSSR